MIRAFASCVAAVLAVGSLAQSEKSLSIEDAVSFGLKHSPKLAAGLAEVEAARALTKGTRGMEGPQLVFNGFAARSTMATPYGSAMGVSPSTTVVAPEGNWLDAGLMLMVPLYTGGALSAMTAAADALEKAAMAGLFEMRAEVALEVRMAFLEALFAQRQVLTAASRLDAAKAMAENARTLLANGKGIEASVRRAEAEQSEAEAELLSMQAERKKMVLELLLVMGESLDAPVTLEDSSASALPQLAFDDLLKAAKASRGEAVQARQRVRAAKAERRAAEAALGPQLYGVAMGDIFSPQDAMGRRSGGSLGLALSLPLFDGGQRRAASRQAQAMIVQAEAELSVVERRIEVDLRKVWLDLETAQQQKVSAERGEQSALSAYNTQVVRVESEVGIFVDQLDALAALTRARSNSVRAEFDLQLAVAKLYRTAGLVGPTATPEVTK